MVHRELWGLIALTLALGACTGVSVVGGPATPADGGIDVPVSCTALQLDCNGRCVDPRSDSNHCGACNTACTAMQACVSGTCQVRCPGTQTACNGACVNLQTDTQNCAACGRACGPGQVCNLGRCSVTCAPTLATCTATAQPDAGELGPASYCADLHSDRSNCGVCGHQCPDGNLCIDSTCRVSCPPGQTACENTCADLRTDNANCGTCGTICPSGQSCTNGACTASCSAGLTVCSGACANLQADNANCGTCGTICPSGQVCSRGVCGATCAPPLVTCGGDDGGVARCADLNTDPSNCGACGVACSLAHTATAGCTAGACVVVRCDDGFGDCDGLASNGCETDLHTSTAHCGACGAACNLPNVSSQSCSAGVCTVPPGACTSGFADCDMVASNGCETSTRTDNANCGLCGHSCGAGQVCSGGVCSTTCGAGLSTCGMGDTAFCTNLQIDPTNCGACGVVCALPSVASNSCSAGACTVVRCDPNTGDCDGVAANGCETNLRTDNTNCGACGRGCTLPNASGTCMNSVCTVAMCTAGFADCDGQAANGCEVDSRTDNANCGACGRVCAAGQVCSSGACSTTCDASLTTCPSAGGAAPFCANIQIDPLNCGGCARVCALPSVAANGCAMGTCTVVTCNPSTGNCDGNAANGCETNLQTSQANCGACGRACTLPNASATCAGGACGVTACTLGFANCNGLDADGCEVDARTDNANCGACGRVCSAGQVCSAGVCSTTCGGSLTTCPARGAMASYCANTQVDPANCGACGQSCALAHTATNGCTTGACTVSRCDTGWGDCNGTAADGCEENLQTSTAHCGACRRACTLPHVVTQSCVAGGCVINPGACAVGFANCNGMAADGCEVDTRSDNANCGACANACRAGQSCVAGVCETTCAAPARVCGSGATAFCTDPMIDPRNCGACGQSCALANTTVAGCTAGACTVVTCAAGWGNCDANPANGCETSLGSSVAHCGACGHSCALANASATCTAGACAVTTCNAGFADCDGDPANGCEVNTRTDTGHCGSCRSACTTGQVCAAGVCGTTCLPPNTTCMGSVASCTNTAVDPLNCGGCGRACALANTTVAGCAGGVCTVVTCAVGHGNCDGNAANGCEADTASSTANCGRCGNACATGQMCVAGTCANDPRVHGCADGTREGYLSLGSYPNIAACAGGFQVPGVLSTTANPACGRAGGNSGARATGVGCNVADLCAVGWHVCATAREVMTHSPTGCTSAAPTAGQFFTTRQSSTGCGVCATGGSFANPPCNSSSCAVGCAGSDAVANDVFGCGSAGATPSGVCSPLNVFSNNQCSSLPSGWSCGSDGYREAFNLVLTNPAAGGALCCRD